MNTADRVTHSIEVGNFDRIALYVNNVENDVVVRQGEKVSPMSVVTHLIDVEEVAAR